MQISENEVLEKLRSLVNLTFTRSHMAERFGVSYQTVCAVLNGTRTPNDDMLKAIGVRRTTIYETIE